MNKVSDQEIINQILKGDYDLFSEILERYERQIFVYCLRILNFHQENAQDVCAQSFVKAYLNLDSYNPKLKFSSWLYRIAHNEAINWIKKESKQKTYDLDKYSFYFYYQKEDLDFSNLDLEKILDQLSYKDRNFLTLFYLEEKNLQEISDILKITVSSVKTGLHRARIRAKKLIKN